ncbi:MAG: metal-dependent transcriptional regulator [Gemmatimonadota bacterium]|nr:metal-dependent transcriptional regulator [Gemmatimonadota bacterium]
MPDVSTGDSLSRSVEDYLKVIYQIAQGRDAAQTMAIAEQLGVAPPSVSGMVKRLAEDGWLEHVPYKGVKLTEKGLRQALKMVRRHRVLETYLIDKLGYSWDDVHDEAELLEHAVTDRLIEKMAHALGHPTHDPHGAPIPTAEGDVEEEEYVPMSEFEVSTNGELRRVEDADAERLRFLDTLGLRPGTKFRVLSKQPFEGPLTVRIEDDREEVVGYRLASSLRCTPLP